MINATIAKNITNDALKEQHRKKMAATYKLIEVEIEKAAKNGLRKTRIDLTGCIYNESDFLNIKDCLVKEGFTVWGNDHTKAEVNISW